jgi:hypothetical protein
METVYEGMGGSYLFDPPTDNVVLLGRTLTREDAELLEAPVVSVTIYLSSLWGGVIAGLRLSTANKQGRQYLEPNAALTGVVVNASTIIGVGDRVAQVNQDMDVTTLRMSRIRSTHSCGMRFESKRAGRSSSTCSNSISSWRCCAS